MAAPAPGWTDDCCIIARKMGNFELEIALMERWASNVPPEFREQALERSGFAKRLAKARMLLEKVTVQGGVVREVRPPT
ncbi:hypothetical protein [Pseudarthrobacter sp. S9]|uniref:hypothetical protein n=1 Tax=Pseudarthrobacter sp. S9 TaxID=3418421 RepID=UPI003D06CD7C